MLKKFEIGRTKIKGGCQSGKKVVPHDSKVDLHQYFGQKNTNDHFFYYKKTDKVYVKMKNIASYVR